MDGGWLDRVARALAAPRNRRRLVAGWLGAAAAAVGAAAGLRDPRTSAQVCREEDEDCTLWVSCCAGLTCVRQPLNVNVGVCRPGGVAATAPSGSTGSGSGSAASATPTSTPSATATATATRTSTATPTATPTPTPTPKVAATTRQQVKVTVDCLGETEITRVENRGESAITIERIRSLENSTPPYQNDPPAVNRTLEAGKAVRFASGPGPAKGAIRLTRKKIYDDDTQGNVAEVITSVGTVRAECMRTGGGGGGDVPAEELVEITLDCKGTKQDNGEIMETTRIANVGDKVVRVQKVRVLLSGKTFKAPDDFPFVALKPQEGNGGVNSITLESGPGAEPGDWRVSEDEIYGDGDREGAVITFLAGGSEKSVRAFCKKRDRAGG